MTCQHQIFIYWQDPSTERDLRSLERNVRKALEKLLSTGVNGINEDISDASISVMHPTSVCDIPLAIVCWKVAVVIGLPEDFFRGPREAWAGDSDIGWGRIAETELDHGALHGDFIFSEVDEMDGLGELEGSRFEVETVEDVEDSVNSSLASNFSSSLSHSKVDTKSGSREGQWREWQRLPALRMRLLKQLGWKIVEVPYFEWRSLLRSEEQSFLKRLLQRELQKTPQLKSWARQCLLNFKMYHVPRCTT